MNQSLHPVSPAPPPAPPPEPASELAPTHPTAIPAPQPLRPVGIHPPHQHHGLLPAIQSLLYIIVIATFIITFIVQPFRIPSGSMEPTLLVGDFLLVSKQSLGFDEHANILPPSAIHRGEIIIFHFPVDPSMHLIKRVVGLPGDRIRLRDGHVYVNGHVIDEPYAVYRASMPDSFRDNFPHLQSTDPDVNPDWWIRMQTLVDHGELIIPKDSYFVLGDNRNNSEDSRYWGLVPRANIVGKPLFIYFSLRQNEDNPPTRNPSGPNSASPGLAAKSLQPTAAPVRPSPGWIDSIRDVARWDRILRAVH
jgi:signal peptidase I